MRRRGKWERKKRGKEDWEYIRKEEKLGKGKAAAGHQCQEKELHPSAGGVVHCSRRLGPKATRRSPPRTPTSLWTQVSHSPVPLNKLPAYLLH